MFKLLFRSDLEFCIIPRGPQTFHRTALAVSASSDNTQHVPAQNLALNETLHAVMQATKLMLYPITLLIGLIQSFWQASSSHADKYAFVHIAKVEHVYLRSYMHWSALATDLCKYRILLNSTLLQVLQFKTCLVESRGSLFSCSPKVKYRVGL